MLADVCGRQSGQNGDGSGRDGKEKKNGHPIRPPEVAACQEVQTNKNKRDRGTKTIEHFALPDAEGTSLGL
jgi:hypothetical protein